MSKNINHIWNSVRGRTIEQNNISKIDEYTNYGLSLVDGTNPILSEAYEDMKTTSNDLCFVIANSQPWTITEYDSVMDKVYMAACTIDSVFANEKRLYQKAKESCKTDEDRHNVDTLHNDVQNTYSKYVKDIDNCIENPRLCKEEYIASKDTLDRK